MYSTRNLHAQVRKNIKLVFFHSNDVKAFNVVRSVF